MLCMEFVASSCLYIIEFHGIMKLILLCVQNVYSQRYPTTLILFLEVDSMNSVHFLRLQEIIGHILVGTRS